MHGQPLRLSMRADKPILRMRMTKHWRCLAEVLSPHFACLLIHNSALMRTLATPPPRHLLEFRPPNLRNLTLKLPSPLPLSRHQRAGERLQLHRPFGCFVAPTVSSSATVLVHLLRKERCKEGVCTAEVSSGQRRRSLYLILRPKYAPNAAPGGLGELAKPAPDASIRPVTLPEDQHPLDRSDTPQTTMRIISRARLRSFNPKI